MKSPVHKDESADLAEHIGVAWDDLTGSVLDCNEVWKARCKEFGYIHDKVVYKKIPREQGRRQEGAPDIVERHQQERRGETDLPEQGRGH